MRAERFFLAMNDIQDRYVMEAVTYRATVRRIIFPILRGVAAACLVLILGFSAVMAISVEAREEIFGWIREQVETFTKYHYENPPTDPDAETGTSEFSRYMLTEVPEGYTLVMDSTDSALRLVVYYSEELGYLYFGASNDGAAYVEEEGHTICQTQVHDMDAELYIAEDPSKQSTIVWVCGDIFFYISAFLSPEELIYYAEHVSLVPTVEEKWPEYYLTWIPEGYWKIEERNIDDQRILIYTDGTHNLTLSCSRSGAPAFYNPPKNADQKTVTVHGQAADLYLSPDNSDAGAVIWTEDEILFVVFGTFGEDDLLRLAESVSIRPKEYTLGYTPKRYTLMNEDHHGGRTRYVYADYETNRLFYFSYILKSEGSQYIVNHENSTTHSVIVRGVAADLYLPDDPESGDASIVWTEGDLLMSIQGIFSREELIEMAENVILRPRDYYLGYVPEGYSQFLHDQTRGASMRIYMDAEGKTLRFLYSRDTDGISMMFSHDNHTRCPAAVHGLEVDFLKGNDPEEDNALIWTEDDTVFFVSGFLNQEELERIANSITESTVTYGNEMESPNR